MPDTGITSPAVMNCLPCAAMVVDSNRRIKVVNDRFCTLFGLNDGKQVAGESFAELARRLTLKGNDGLLALGDNLAPGDAELEPVTHIVLASGHSCEARAARLDDGKTLITIAYTDRGPDALGHLIAGEIIDHLPGATVRLVMRADDSIHCLFASAMSPALLGRTIDELTDPAFDFRALLQPDDLPIFLRTLASPRSEVDQIDIQFRIVNAICGPIWVRCVGSVERSSDGIVICDLRFRDIEDRIAVSEDRTRLQTLLDMVLDNVPLMVSVRDAKTDCFEYVNRTFETVVNKSREQILNQSGSIIFGKSQNAERRSLSAKVIEQGEVVTFPENEIDTPTIGRRILRSAKYPLFDEAGVVRHVLSITEDVTERRHIQAELKRHENRLNDAIESFTDAIALFDADDRLVLFNSRYAGIWPRGDFEIRHGDTYEELVRAYAEEANRNGAEIDIGNYVSMRVNGHRNPPSTREVQLFNGTWLQVTDRAASEGGVVVTGTDITPLKEREDRLRKTGAEAIRAKEVAEIANRSKSNFLENMSHELRTPLNAIIGFSEIIQDALLGNDAIAEYQNYAGDIHESGIHLLDLINDILDMSKIEAGKLELAEAPVHLAEPIELALRLVNDRADQGGVSLITDIDPALPPITGDLRKIKQIVINLLSNAVKFTPAGGTVTIRAWRAPTGEFIIDVIDTGIGIADEDLPKIFQAFGQAETGLDRQYEGTGLGVNLAKALTELHGGEFTLSSQTEGPDKGTTATIRLPASRALS